MYLNKTKRKDTQLHGAGSKHPHQTHITNTFGSYQLKKHSSLKTRVVFPINIQYLRGQL